MALDRKIYLDHAATTPVDPKVLEEMFPHFNLIHGNPSSMYATGRQAKKALEDARREVATLINASPEEIIFTGSGTESDNLALLGAARANKDYGDHIIVSAVEHKAVLEAARELVREGFRVSYLKVDADGLIDVGECMSLISDKTILVSVMYANNEIGTIQPIKELARTLMSVKNSNSFPLLHTDACQAAGALSINVAELGVDLMTLNGSKIYGPKGVGILYKRSRVTIAPIILGGEQEMGLRAGTENVPLIVGFSKALQQAELMRGAESARLTELRDYFMEELKKKIPNLIVNGSREYRLPNNVHVSIPNVEGEAILLLLDNSGIEASTGSACSANDLNPSHVLLAIGQTPEFAHGSIRFSLGRETTREQLDYVADVLAQTVERLSSMSALTAKI